MELKVTLQDVYCLRQVLVLFAVMSEADTYGTESDLPGCLLSETGVGAVRSDERG
jgi:hypothetical protein